MVATWYKYYLILVQLQMEQNQIQLSDNAANKSPTVTSTDTYSGGALDREVAAYLVGNTTSVCVPD
jgi:hypothetical protein